MHDGTKSVAPDVLSCDDAGAALACETMNRTATNDDLRREDPALNERNPADFLSRRAQALADSDDATPTYDERGFVVDAYDDPKVAGVTCYVSRAKTGGIKGGLGLAEDRAEASIACRQVGPIRFKGELMDGDEVFKERTSLVFKTMQVVRFLDKKRNTLVYLVYSDRMIEGSPQNAVTAIPILPWGQQ